MRITRIVLSLAFALVVATTARAATDTRTLRDFGGHEGVNRLTTDFVTRVLHDNRINRYFAHVNGPKFIGLLSSQICETLGGPCKYTGRSMVETHKGMGVKTKDFNALVEDLCATMDAARIPARSQNKLLGKLAPMWHDIVSK